MSLRDFLKKMEKKKEILHVKQEVSPALEISHIMRSFDHEGPVLSFENVRGLTTRVVGNVCGTRKRLCSALDVDAGNLYRTLTEAWRSPRKAETVSDSPAKEVPGKTDLSKIPFLLHFERDADRYITSACLNARNAEDEVENVSIHRLQVLDRDHVAIRLVPRHLFRLWKMAKEKKEDLDVSISIGVHPAVLLAASSPIPFGANEFDVANALMNGGLRLVECEHVDACAPAETELVLEGRISVTKEIVEGPFVDITGTYDVQRKQPVVDIIGVMHRENYLYEALLPGGAEHRLLMGLPHEVLIWDAVSKVVPNVHAVNLSTGGCGWLHAVISVEKQVDGDGKNVLLAAFAAHPSLKHAVVVDDDINVYDPCDVEWAIATRFQASEDLMVISNTRGSTLDSSANQETGLTTKVGVDATRPMTKPPEKFTRARIPVNRRIEALAQRLHGM